MLSCSSQSFLGEKANSCSISRLLMSKIVIESFFPAALASCLLNTSLPKALALPYSSWHHTHRQNYVGTFPKVCAFLISFVSLMTSILCTHINLSPLPCFATEGRSAKWPSMLLERECTDGSLQSETLACVSFDVESGVRVQGVRVSA